MASECCFVWSCCFPYLKLCPVCVVLSVISLRLAPYLEPSSTMVALEWMDVEPLIGCKVSDYIIQHKRVEDPSEAEIYTGTKMKSKA